MSSNAQVLARGETFYGPTKTCPTTYGADSIAAEGKEVEFFDATYRRAVKGRIMRNVSGDTLYAGQTVVHANGYTNQRFDHSTTASPDVAGVIDALLPAAGVRTGDLCIVFQEGVAKVLFPTSTSGAQGDVVIANTSGMAAVVGIASVTAPQLAVSLGRLTKTVTTTSGNTLQWVDLDVA